VRNIAPATANLVVTHVTSLDFLGSFCRAKLQPEAVPSLVILADFSANLMRDLSVVEGQRLTIALPPESLHVFAKE
jgi:iron(III) transport system ATP-binding protein